MLEAPVAVVAEQARAHVAGRHSPSSPPRARPRRCVNGPRASAPDARAAMESAKNRVRDRRGALLPGVVGERAQIIEVGARAGDAPCGVRKLLAKLPFRRRPDVLGVRGKRPAHPADQRRVAGDRGRRVEDNACGASRRRRGSSRASTQAWPNRRRRLTEGSRLRSARNAFERRGYAGLRLGPFARPRARAPDRPSGIPADRAPPPRSRGCRSCTLPSVGWRSETMSCATPRFSSPRISCAMKVSERRG